MISTYKKYIENTHCCNRIATVVNNPEDSNIPCTYLPKYRGYYIESLRIGCEKMIYCLYCGKKYPNELCDTWFYILEKEYNIDLPLIQHERIPKQFLTDEWWRQLGDENMPALPPEAIGRQIRDNEELKKFWEEADRQFEEDTKNYKGPHCCYSTHLAVRENYPEKNSPCIYDPKWRGYYLKKLNGMGREEINFCPRCGKQYPAQLSEKWFETLEKEYGLDNPGTPAQRRKIPSQFLTDEWWKIRNL